MACWNVEHAACVIYTIFFVTITINQMKGGSSKLPPSHKQW